MLVLFRKVGQTIRIGNNQVEVTVLEIHGRTVRFGIKAPADVPILRDELFSASFLKMDSVGTAGLAR